MAVVATPLGSNLVLVMDNGIGAGGQQLSVNRVFRDVSPNASDADVYAVAQTLIGLQSRTNHYIERRNFMQLEDI